ncbi:Protein of unknown function [Bacillus mycoides]|nr:Protein of unknown function [Bacillus mycoides]
MSSMSIIEELQLLDQE